MTDYVLNDALLQAAKDADWGQVVANGGPPCFHLDGNRFCLRAERWPGHWMADRIGGHAFLSLHTALQALAPTPPAYCNAPAPADAPTEFRMAWAFPHGNAGVGNWRSSWYRPDIEAWVRSLNAEHGRGTHWLEERATDGSITTIKLDTP